MPSTAQQRLAELEAIRSASAMGRFREHLLVWPFGQIGGTPPNDRQTLEQAIPTCGPGNPSFVRLLALRGLLAGMVSDQPIDVELAFLRLRLQCNGLDLITDGLGSNSASFSTLFGGVTSDPAHFDDDDVPDVPWFWFASPPRLRAGDKLVATVFDSSLNELKRHTPQLAARIIDDRYWRLAYTLDAQDEDDDLAAEGDAEDAMCSLDSEGAL